MYEKVTLREVCPSQNLRHNGLCGETPEITLSRAEQQRATCWRWQEREETMLGTISSKPLIKDGLRRNVLMMDCSRPVGRRRRPRALVRLCSLPLLILFSAAVIIIMGPELLHTPASWRVIAPLGRYTF
jgi:hypothetical protein